LAQDTRDRIGICAAIQVLTVVVQAASQTGLSLACFRGSQAATGVSEDADAGQVQPAAKVTDWRPYVEEFQLSQREKNIECASVDAIPALRRTIRKRKLRRRRDPLIGEPYWVSLKTGFYPENDESMTDQILYDREV
jgi:hypothetical protein